MKFVIPVLISLLLLTKACSSQPGPDEYIYWVNSTKVPCVGVAPTNCLQVFKGEILDPTEWEFFQAPIDGFEFEPGYLYKLLLREETLAGEELPADDGGVRLHGAGDLCDSHARQPSRPSADRLAGALHVVQRPAAGVRTAGLDLLRRQQRLRGVPTYS